MGPRKCAFLVAVALFMRAAAAHAGDNLTPEFVGSIPMEGVESRIDHMAVSPDGKALFVAALANDMVEQIDTECRTAIFQIRGIREPQGVYYILVISRYLAQ
jgi:hypothetical protein